MKYDDFAENLTDHALAERLRTMAERQSGYVRDQREALLREAAKRLEQR